MERTIAFVDLAGFTALTEQHGDEDAATLAEHFSTLAAESLGPGERLVKSIGDAVMLEAQRPAAGVRLVGRLCARTDAEESFPIVRAGLHHGPVVARGDDLFGATVNLASRVTAQASGGQVLATPVVADAAREAGIDTRFVGSVALRNVAEPVELYEVLPCPRPHLRVVDPVCRMALDAWAAPGRLTLEGRDWHFCSLACAAVFAAEPSRYAANSDPG